MSAPKGSSFRSTVFAWRYIVAILCCLAMVACKSPDDGGGRGDATDSHQKGTGGP